MGRSKYTYRLLILSFLGMIACTKNNLDFDPPVIQLESSASSGLTTTVFSFNLAKTMLDNTTKNIFLSRWDWNNDSTWDTPFISRLTVFHRYYAPGNYRTRVMVLDMNGMSDTAFVDISIGQGYSKPRPILTVKPLSGNMYTRFVFDGSLTKDDEDSLDQLKFRWDLDGNGQFESDFLTNPTYEHQYLINGTFHPVMEVKDPSGLSETVTTEINVGLRDTSIFVDFTFTPAYPVTGEEILFDASVSFDPNHPDKPLVYKWDFNFDGAFDMTWLSQPVYHYSYLDESLHQVRLQVMNSLGLINDTVKVVDVGHNNLPPGAIFEVSSYGANIGSELRFEIWESKDLESATSSLAARWDWNGDGTFDTDYCYEKEFFTSFSQTGIIPVAVEIKDEGGLTTLYSHDIGVGDGQNETEILLDKRGVSGYEYYGIVRIGDQWWFAKNLQVQSSMTYNHIFYQNNYQNYFEYGCLYGKPGSSTKPLCPEGWRIPTREDWERLFAHYSEDELYEALIPGGISGFNAQFSGSGALFGSFAGINNYGHYWSTTKPMGTGSMSYWVVSFDRKQKKY